MKCNKCGNVDNFYSVGYGAVDITITNGNKECPEYELNDCGLLGEPDVYWCSRCEEEVEDEDL